MPYPDETHGYFRPIIQSFLKCSSPETDNIKLTAFQKKIKLDFTC